MWCRMSGRPWCGCWRIGLVDRWAVGRAGGWSPAVDADGEPVTTARSPRSPGCCVPARPTTSSPAGPRHAAVVRRERPHPGAQLSLFEQHEGFRSRSPPPAFPPAGPVPGGMPPHPGPGRVEDPLREGHRPASAAVPNSRSTVCGVRRSASPATCSPGWPCSPSTANRRKPNRKRSATGCCTPPGGSSTGSVAAGYGYPKPGRRPTRWPRRSPDPGPARPRLTPASPPLRKERHPSGPWNRRPPVRQPASDPCPHPEHQHQNGGQKDQKQRRSQRERARLVRQPHLVTNEPRRILRIGH